MQPTLLVCLSLCHLPCNNQRHGYNGKNNANSAIRPSPICFMKLIGQWRPRERSDNVRRGGECISQTTISEGGGIRGNHINGEDCTSKANRVERLNKLSQNSSDSDGRLGDTHLRSTVGRDIVATSHHNQTHDGN